MATGSRNLRRGAALAMLFAVAALAGPGQAQQPGPARARGAITAIAGDRVTVKAPEGDVVTFAVATDTTFTAVVPAKLADITPKRFVGVGAVPDGAGMKAVQVMLFPPGVRGGEGQGPWIAGPTSTMTNADVAAVTSAGSGQLTLETGGKAYQISVPPDASITTTEPGSRALLVPGAFVWFATLAPVDGVPTARSLVVGKDGLKPPR